MILQLLISCFVITSGMQMAQGAQGAQGSRISVEKCNDYSKNPDHSSIDAAAHQVWVIFERPLIRPFYIGGILISTNFVLSAYSDHLSIENVRVEFKSTQAIYHVTKSYQRYLDNDLNEQLGLLLLKLNDHVPLNSLYRPACLWVEHNFDTDTAEQLIGDRTASRFSFQLEEVYILNITDCLDVGRDLRGQSIFCTQSPRYDIEFLDVISGSGVSIQKRYGDVPSNYYIYGIVLHARSDLAFSAKIYDNLYWIEANVWGPRSICGRRKIKGQPLITHSSATSHGEFPWHVALFEKENHDWKYICGGTLLSQTAVLTAAHCLTNNQMQPKNSEKLKVSIGNYNLDTSSIYTEERRVLNFSRHETYDTETYKNDIAIIKLRKEVKYSDYIQPICLPSPDFIYSETILPGWGANENDVYEKVLVKGSFPIVDKETCKKSGELAMQIFVNDNSFCAGARNKTSACAGDSGGGLVSEVDNQSYILGIVSIRIGTAELTCNPNQYVIFTNVMNFYKWILNNNIYDVDDDD